MKNLQHVNLIGKKFKHEKNVYLRELSVIQQLLTRKIDSIKKIMVYQQEYSNNTKFKKSYTIPALSQNMDQFLLKLAALIKKEEIEITQLKKKKEMVIERLTVLEHKLKMMENFRDKILQAKTELEEKLIQRAIDDLIAIKHTRGDHE